jgi:two-component system chemotaxis sensor kinase CheA
MSAPAASALAAFLQEAPARLAVLRRHAALLTEGDALHPARDAALELQRAAAACHLSRFAALAGKLAGVFDYAALHPQSAEGSVAFSAFLGDGAELLERALAALAAGQGEPESDFAAFRDRYHFAFADGEERSAPPPAVAPPSAAAPAAAPPAPDAELMELFVSEAEEQMEVVTECLLLLESDPAGDHVHRLFRAMHILKGSASQVGLAPMAEVAHATEELLARLRQGSLPCTTELIYLCLEAVDTLRKFLYRRWEGDAAMQQGVRTLLDRLARLAAEPVTVRPAPAAAVPRPLAPAPHSDLQPRLVRVLADRLDRMSAAVGRLAEARTQVVGRLADLERLEQQVSAFSRSAATPPELAARLQDVGSFVRQVDVDLEDFARLTDLLEREIRRATLVPIGGLYIRVARTVREAAAAEGKRVQLTLHGADTELDGRLLHQISDPLVHLVRNAVAHGIESDDERYAAGKSAQASLTVRAYRRPNLVCLEVEDDGRGLDFEAIRRAAIEARIVTPADAPRLEHSDLLRLCFEPGFSTRAFGNQVAGRGVGLDVVAAAMTALNAEIEVRTRPGVGGRFTLKIPLQPLTEQAARSRRPACGTPLVLVVEPSLLYFRRLAECFRRQGMEAAHCATASEALAMLEWNEPALILCATGLGEMGAFELARLLRAEPSTAHIPLIALGSGEGTALMEAYRAGCSELLDRNQSPPRIAERLAGFLRSRKEGFQPTQMVSPAESALSGDLSRMDLPSFVQMLLHTRQTGMLHVNSAAADGFLLFQNGELFHAECGELVGDEAVLRIVGACSGAVTGVCKFVPGPVSHTRTVLRTATELMLEALRRQDESGRPQPPDFGGQA